MERPQSIIWFERLFLGSLALGSLNSILNWSAIQAVVAATPNSELLPSWFTFATMAFGIGSNLLLWFFIARKGAVVAKWILVVLIGIGILSLPTVFATPYPLHMKLISLINFALQGAAIFMLFRPDTVEWFGGKKQNISDHFD